MKIGKKVSKAVNVCFLVDFGLFLFLGVTLSIWNPVSLKLTIWVLGSLAAIMVLLTLSGFFQVEDEPTRKYKLRVSKLSFGIIRWMILVLLLGYVDTGLLALFPAYKLASFLATMVLVLIYYLVVQPKLDKLFLAKVTDKINETAVKKALNSRSKLTDPELSWRLWQRNGWIPPKLNQIGFLWDNPYHKKASEIDRLLNSVDSAKYKTLKEISTKFWKSTLPDLNDLGSKMGLEVVVRIGTQWVYFKKRILFLNLTLLSWNHYTWEVSGLWKKKAESYW